MKAVASSTDLGLAMPFGLRRFVVVGQKAVASGDFLLDDLPGTSGRLDVLLRCVRAAMLYSHGVRRDVVVYLLLGGGPRAPRALRFAGAEAAFLRPDERSLAVLVKKALGADGVDEVSGAQTRRDGFAAVRPGIAVANGGLAAVLADVGASRLYVLEEGAPDVRAETEVGGADEAFFVGDHLGFDEPTRAALAAAGARPIGVGPVGVHAEDAVAILSNELDRRRAT
jgi:tRNA (pseudouridine54-N1)-methyltransferase